MQFFKLSLNTLMKVSDVDSLKKKSDLLNYFALQFSFKPLDQIRFSQRKNGFKQSNLFCFHLPSKLVICTAA